VGRFNPRAPRGARLGKTAGQAADHKFQSTRPARGATCVISRSLFVLPVSIHAPRAGRDRGRKTWMGGLSGFNPRAPRGARPHTFRLPSTSRRFQSTRPARGATLVRRHECHYIRVSIHAPRAGRDGSYPHSTRSFLRFQSTRPARGATICGGSGTLRAMFQSTRPARGATTTSSDHHNRHPVSIHAPRAGRDRDHCFPGVPQEVSIHAPRAGRDRAQGRDNLRQRVSIHAPRAGRDRRIAPLPAPFEVSIHAPRAGRDPVSGLTRWIMACFNPRAPRGARPKREPLLLRQSSFNPRAPRGARQRGLPLP